MNEYYAPNPLPPDIMGSSSYSTSYAQFLEVGTLTDGIIVMKEGYIHNVKDPISALDAANKQYVLDNASGDSGAFKTWKNAVNAATTNNIVLSGLQIVDGVTLEEEYRVLVKNQNVLEDNGIYLVSSGQWTRTLDASILPEVQASGTAIYIISGSSNSNKVFICNTVSSGPNFNPVNYGAAIDFIPFGQSTPGGGNKEVQFNNSGVLDGSPNLIWNGTALSSNVLKTNTIEPNSTSTDVNLYTNHGAPIIIGNVVSPTLTNNILSNSGSLILGNLTNNINRLTGTTRVSGTGANVYIATGSGSLGGTMALITGNSSNGPGPSITLRPGSGSSSDGNVIVNPVSPSDSFSSTTGSLVVNGGLGVSGSITTNGTLTGTLLAPSGRMLIGSNNGTVIPVNMSGDASITNTGVVTLTNVIVPGSYTNSNITVDAKGRITSASNGSTGSEGSGGIPGGTNHNLQFNNSGAFGGISKWNYDPNSTPFGGTVTANTITGTVGTSLFIYGSSPSVDDNTVPGLFNLGTTQLGGDVLMGFNGPITQPISNPNPKIRMGVGSSSIVDVNGIMNITGTNPSISPETGTVVITGDDAGLGIIGSLNVGGTITGNSILPSGNIFVGSNTNYATRAVLTGDASITNTGVLSLTNVVAPGSYTNSNITIDAKGRITSASNGSTGSGGSGGIPGGPNNSLQFNNSGAFGGSSKISYIENTEIEFMNNPVQVEGLIGTIGSSIIIFSSDRGGTQFEGTNQRFGGIINTGATIMTGDVYMGLNIFDLTGTNDLRTNLVSIGNPNDYSNVSIQNSSLTIYSTSDSTYFGDGTVVISGGVGIVQSLNVKNTVNTSVVICDTGFIENIMQEDRIGAPNIFYNNLYNTVINTATGSNSPALYTEGNTVVGGSLTVDGSILGSSVMIMCTERNTSVLLEQGLINTGPTALSGDILITGDILNIHGTEAYTQYIQIGDGLHPVNITCQDASLSFYSTVDSYDVSSGSIFTTGGVGIGLSLNVGGNISSTVINSTNVNIRNNLNVENNITSYGITSTNANIIATLDVGGDINQDIISGNQCNLANTIITNVEGGAPSTKALLVNGNTDIEGNMYVDGVTSMTNAIVGNSIRIDGTATISGVTDSFSSTSGSLILTGGLGIGKSLFVGSTTTSQVIKATVAKIDTLAVDNFFVKNLVNVYTNNAYTFLVATNNILTNYQAPSDGYLNITLSRNTISTSNVNAALYMNSGTTINPTNIYGVVSIGSVSGVDYPAAGGAICYPICKGEYVNCYTTSSIGLPSPGGTGTINITFRGIRNTI